LKGGVLLPVPEKDGGLSLLPNGGEPFQVVLKVALAAEEDQRSKLIRFAIPPAIRNQLHLTREKDVELLSAPGIVGKDRHRHFAANTELRVRFEKKVTVSDGKEVERKALVEVDSLTILKVQGERLMGSVWFSPRQVPEGGVLLNLPKGAEYVGTSLRTSWIRREAAGLRLVLPQRYREPFAVHFAVSRESKKPTELVLPSLKENHGREGGFVLIEPEDGHAEVRADGLRERIPIARLPVALRGLVPEMAHYSRASAGTALQIHLKRFTAMKTPPIVLDRVKMFTAFEENGSALSVLTFDAPDTLGGQMVIPGVPGAEIWSLKVNGQPKKVYTQASGEWILPLSRSKTVSRVELALLVRGDKLGLSGTLATTLPAVGLPARQVFLGIALPERVQLLSLDGPVSPALKGIPGEMPKEFMGRRYTFSRSFYKGDAMKVSVLYREPRKE
ncbi:MAG: hypothetical protein ACYTGH_17165, partial [Planctomycetota bacterium]